MRGPSPRGDKLGPLGDKVLFENEFVRIWSVKLDPGERQAWHQHHLPYIIVPMQGLAAKFLKSMADYPPSQTPWSFNLEKIQKQIESAAAGQ